MNEQQLIQTKRRNKMPNTNEKLIGINALNGTLESNQKEIDILQDYKAFLQRGHVILAQHSKVIESVLNKNRFEIQNISNFYKTGPSKVIEDGDQVVISGDLKIRSSRKPLVNNKTLYERGTKLSSKIGGEIEELSNGQISFSMNGYSLDKAEKISFNIWIHA
jgi:hypothetical protein